jgi:hypothetical protein
MVKMATMTKTTKKTKTSTSPREKGVISQVKTAFKATNRLATMVGMIFGGFVPVAAYYVGHHEANTTTAHGVVMMALVLGGLVFSAKTVFKWAKMAYADGWKALGFVVLLEGVMTLSHNVYLSGFSLALLVVINGVASGVTLSKK